MEHKPEESKFKTCINIFPEELWGIILDSMEEDSRNIESVLAAFPELSLRLHGRKPNWYIDQAFPHIFKQLFRCLDIEPFLALRGVSKRWRNITEEFLKNDPTYHPYNQNGINRRNISYGQFNYIEFGTPCPTLEGTEIIQKRHKQMLDHPRNPFFIGRLGVSNKDVPSPLEPFLQASLEFLKYYGHHISHFEFTVELDQNKRFEGFHEDPEGLFGAIFECISYTPNVRFLKVNLLYEDYMLSQIAFPPEYANQIPELPHLETLILEDQSTNQNGTLTNAFSVASWITSTKRLEIPLNSNMFSYGVNFPNLCELSLDMSSPEGLDGDLNFNDLAFLNQDICPVLRKLSFTSFGLVDVCINQLFNLLARLEIEEMQLLGECTVANDQNCNLSPLPSIKYFRVRDGDKHDFEFLKMFTSLEYLYLDYDCDEPTEKKPGWLRNYSREDRGFSSQLRMYMNELVVPKDVNIWEALPTVKFIGVQMSDILWQYSRECGNKRFRVKLVDYYN